MCIQADHHHPSSHRYQQQLIHSRCLNLIHTVISSHEHADPWRHEHRNSWPTLSLWWLRQLFSEGKLNATANVTSVEEIAKVEHSDHDMT